MTSQLLSYHSRLIVDEMAVVQHCKDEVRLQQCANTIALMARNLSKDSKVRLLVFGSDRS